ncbi:hypothetical protein J422_06366 [Methanocaldococcus villosus KIN24-T80]|uniref:SAM-dependent methyltransferase n=1 Tax=Methanocaldococcus villosus KIN24-T80 TaxID=1069083 RepID=N6VX54_9EURY|nr:RlmF-related methyltransferase [Methanocaldococcus villosus]ENN95692.1 hypothetical protein J422_06366 [Methanocaldococcus villosus KIN24-T80]
MLGLKIEEALKYNENLKKYVFEDKGKLKINFKDKKALMEYNRTVIKVLFGLDIEFHEKGLIPPVMSRYLFVKKSFETLERLGIKEAEVLEIGTGHSAIIAMLIKKLYNANVYATEVDKEFLEYARKNILKNNLKIELIDSKGKILKGIDEIKNKRFDLIISYPPYYSSNSKPSGRKFGGALAKEVELIGGGRFGEKFSFRLIEESYNFLKDKGVLSIMLPKKPDKRREIIIEKMNEYYEVEVDKIKLGNRERYVIKGIKDV